MSEVTVNLKNGDRLENFSIQEGAPLEISISPFSTPTRNKLKTGNYSSTPLNTFGEAIHEMEENHRRQVAHLEMKVDSLSKEIDFMNENLNTSY